MRSDLLYELLEFGKHSRSVARSAAPLPREREEDWPNAEVSFVGPFYYLREKIYEWTRITLVEILVKRALKTDSLHLLSIADATANEGPTFNFNVLFRFGEYPSQRILQPRQAFPAPS